MVAAASLPAPLVVAQGRRHSPWTGISTHACSYNRLWGGRRRSCYCCCRRRNDRQQLQKLCAVHGDVQVQQQTATVVAEAEEEWRRLVHLIEAGQDEEMDGEAKAYAAEYSARWQLSPAQERCVAIAVACGQRAVLEVREGGGGGGGGGGRPRVLWHPPALRFSLSEHVTSNSESVMLHSCPSKRCMDSGRCLSSSWLQPRLCFTCRHCVC